MLNIEKYKEEINEAINDRYVEDILCEINENIMGERPLVDCCYSGSEMCENCHKNVMKWLLEEYKEPILSDEAKAYLKAIIESVECTKISKYLSSSYAYELRIYDKDGYILIACSKGTKLYEYFKNMQDYKNYTPEELGLC